MTTPSVAVSGWAHQGRRGTVDERQRMWTSGKRRSSNAPEPSARCARMDFGGCWRASAVREHHCCPRDAVGGGTQRGARRARRGLSAAAEQFPPPAPSRRETASTGREMNGSAVTRDQTAFTFTSRGRSRRRRSGGRSASGSGRRAAPAGANPHNARGSAGRAQRLAWACGYAWQPGSRAHHADRPPVKRMWLSVR